MAWQCGRCAAASGEGAFTLSPDTATPGYVEVRLGAIVRNYEKLREGTSGCRVGAVVKANAYGLGASRIAQSLYDADCRQFFVATIEEGIALRRQLPANTEAEIFVFEGYRSDSKQTLLENSLFPVLNTSAQAREWLAVGAPSALHVDTGMTRLGIDLDELAQLYTADKISERLQLRYLMTHLACADEPGHPQNELQLERFDKAREIAHDVEVSIANSAGAFLDPRFHGDLIRPGIALYGGNPFADHENPMETVATLYGRILQLREVPESVSIGYGASFEASANSRIATVGVGYADGYPRVLGNAALAAVKGIRVPVVGRVSMDLSTIDVSDIDAANITVGDYVEMFGDFVSIDEIAALSSTISYEILTGLGSRLPRIYVD